MKKDHYVTAVYAARLANCRNRDCWIENNLSFINSRILKEAQNGKKNLSIPIVSLIVGSEDIYECKEMLSIIEKNLISRGYEIKIDMNGNVCIFW